MKYKIKVTKKDIRNGIPKKYNSCPISLSLKRKFKTKDVYTDIGFEGVWMVVDNTKYLVINKHQDKVTNFIGKFDHYFDGKEYHIYDARILKPISFEIIKDHSFKQVSYKEH